MDYWFFLSYAREDNTDVRKDQRGALKPFVQLFYEDLCREIRAKAGLSINKEVGFFDDAEIEPGEKWPEKLASALQQSRVFIGLYSPTYFKKEYCGKEWAVFSSRLEAYAKNLTPGAESPRLMLPVFWGAEKDVIDGIPDELKDIQFKSADYRDHAQYGVRQMLRNNKHKNRYNDFVTTLATMVIDAAKKHSLPVLNDLPGIKEVNSAFSATRNQPTENMSAQPAKSDPRRVKYIFVAGRKDELEGLNPPNASLVRYGQKGDEWRPWMPELEDDALYIVQGAISELQDLKLAHEESIPPDENLLVKVEDAQNNNRIVVIVVDMWTLKLPTYRKLMRDLDNRMRHDDRTKQFFNCITLVLRNKKDEEAENDLEAALEEAFDRSTRFNSLDFLSKIKSGAELKEQLPKVLLITQKNILHRAQVLKTAKADNPVTLPHLKNTREETTR